MAKNPTNQEMYNKIIEIESMMRKMLKEEEFIIKDGFKLKKDELEELNLLKQLKGNDIKRLYSDIIDWKQMIWESCPDKESVADKKTIDYRCRKTGKNCRFIDCYRNKQ